MKPHRVSSRAVIIKGTKLLALHRYKDGKEYYVFPGGGLKERESPEEAVVREVKEEISVNVRVLEKFEHLWPNDEEQFFFLCEYLSGKVGLSKESEEAQRQTKDNTYRPVLLDVRGLQNLALYPTEVRDKIVTRFGNLPKAEHPL
jgi:8-oxo-dGTP pyrophosphatase MutT (NUDIX family)